MNHLFRYLYQGSSHQNIHVLPLNVEQSEPVEYAKKPMIRVSNACWRLLGFEFTVKMLPVHLEDQHLVMFRPEIEADAVASSSSDLLFYMNRPQAEVLDNLSYQNFHENFIIHTRWPKIRPEQPVYDYSEGRHYITNKDGGECVFRLFWISPNRGDLYDLRVGKQIFGTRRRRLHYISRSRPRFGRP